MPEPQPRTSRLVWIRQRLFSTSLFLLAARLAGAGAGFLAQLILAKQLPADHLGIYFTATSVVVIGGVLAAHGYPSIAIRFVSRYRDPRGAAFLSRFVRYAQHQTFILAGIISAAVAGAALAWPDLSEETRVAFLLAGLTVPFVASFRLYGSLAMAVRAFRLAYLPDVSLKPLILLVALAVLLLLGIRIDLVTVMVILTAATIVLSLGQRAMLARLFPVSLRPGRRPGDRRASAASLAMRWRREAHTVLLVAIFSQFLAELSILLATPVLSTAEIGVFGLCLKLAFLIGFFVLLTQNIATPDLADTLGKGGERKHGSRLAASSAAATLSSLGAAFVCFQWGEQILRLFGPNFAAGYSALLMLVAAQVVRAFFGPTNAVLTLVGAQKLNLLATGLAVAVLAVATIALGAIFGLNGAAAALLVTTFFWSVLSAVLLQRRAGVRVDLLSAMAAWRTERLAARPPHAAAPPRAGEAQPAA